MCRETLPLFEEGENDLSGMGDAGGSLASRTVNSEDAAGKQLDIASEFLLKTLVPKPSLREMGGITFVTAYTWRAAVKDLQIKSLRILKRHLPPNFVEAAGIDLASAARKLHGNTAFKLVVPVPCGHSQRSDCLSYRLAVVVALQLDASFAAVLESPVTRGSSHPKQSQNFRKPRVKCPISGKALLVDDVCTTGRHMSLSLAALREAGAGAFGIAWIGSR